MQNSTPKNEDDDSTSEYDGENEVETDNIMADNLTSGKRKANKQVSKQVNKSSLRPKTMADVVEVNSRKKHAVDEVQNILSLKVSRVQDQCIQKKEQVISEKKGSKRAFCSPGFMSAYLEFRKKQKENNEAFVASNQSLNDSLTRNTRICGAAFNEDDNDDADALSENDEADALNENDDDVGDEYEGDQELEDEVLSNYGREGMQETEPEKAPNRKRHRGPTILPKVHARTRDECEVIVSREIVQEFKQFLGTVARDSELAPLNYINFPSLPTLDKMWEYVQVRSNIIHFVGFHFLHN
ncbi:protein PFC0760c-like isoform X2 [Chenopodium quinoa]|uniref:protein PFC0760c-like isoform X2 n=1 Tax=Chenopodium quinoa TaxID=63459 RepID=UPI000B773917|nr:protein PFC0760c-like isoform X2 [Chenopodium quinoa]